MLRLSSESLKTQTPGGERTLHDLGYHFFRLGLACRDAVVGSRFPEARLPEIAPSELTDGVAIPSSGAWVREQLAS